MNNSDLYTFLENSPKKIRKIKLNKSPILLDIEIRENLDEYNIISDELLLERHKFISTNKKFRNKILSLYNENTFEDSQLDIYPEESIYKKFIYNSDSILMKEFHRADWQNKLIIMDKFKDERLRYFAKILIFEEQPNLLDKKNFLKVQEHFRKRIMSANKEKWLTIYDAYKKIDDLRVKYDNNKENLLILEDVNKYIENLEKNLNL